jgi:Cdc6-like AAA superfamily ATPase
MLIGTSNDINVQYTLLGKVQMSETEVQTIIFQVYGSEAIVSILKDKIDLVREKLGIELVISDTLIRYLVNKLQ